MQETVLLYAGNGVIVRVFLINQSNMEQNEQPQQEADQYKELTKVCGRLTYISEPKKFITIFLLYQAGMLVYFLVTMQPANPVLKVITIATYIAITIILVIFPFVDPGIIPKIVGKEEHQKIPINMALVGEGREGYYYKEYCYVAKTHSFWAKYCGNCAIYRPSRTLHCYTCQVCIQKLDHHCPWLGACIGKRNYRFYLLYLLFMAVALCLITQQTVNFIVIRSFSDSQVQYIFNILLLVLSVPTGLFVVILIGVHIKLSRENLTTNELWHSKWDLQSGNPFQKTFFIKNYMKIFANIYTSKLDYQRNHAAQDMSIKHQTESHLNIKKDEQSIAPTTHASQTIQQVRGVQIVLKLNAPTQ